MFFHKNHLYKILFKAIILHLSRKVNLFCAAHFPFGAQDKPFRNYSPKSFENKNGYLAFDENERKNRHRLYGRR